MTNEQYVAIIGDQSETQTCHGPFAELDALFAWAGEAGYERERVSFYRITAPRTERPAIAELEAAARARVGGRRMTIIEVMETTDWQLLAAQKLALLKAIEDIEVEKAAPTSVHMLGEAEPGMLEGLVNWIDALQDAAREAGMPVVFLTEDAESEEAVLLVNAPAAPDFAAVLAGPGTMSEIAELLSDLDE